MPRVSNLPLLAVTSVQALLIHVFRYYIPEHVQEHVDYVTPGVKHLGVKGGTSSSLAKRTKNLRNPGLPSLTKPLDIALDILKEALLETCDLAITPECIQGKAPVDLSSVEMDADSKQPCITSQSETRQPPETSLEFLKI